MSNNDNDRPQNPMNRPLTPRNPQPNQVVPATNIPVDPHHGVRTTVPTREELRKGTSRIPTPSNPQPNQVVPEKRTEPAVDPHPSGSTPSIDQLNNPPKRRI